MAGVGRTVLSLRFFGEDLQPAELTRLLGAEPSKAALRGDVLPSGRVQQRGSWRLIVEDQELGGLEAQIQALLARLTDDLGVWADLNARYQGDLFAGLFMQAGAEGLDLKPGTLAMIGERGLRLGLNLYAPDDD